LLGCAFAAPALGEAGAEKPADNGEPGLLARVNGAPITEAQVLRRLKAVDPQVEDHRGDPNRWARLLENATEAEIRDQLLLQAARTERLEISEEQLDAALMRSREMLGEERFAKMLAQRGASEADYKTFLGNRLLIDRYRSKVTGDVEVDEATMRDYYRGHKESFQAPARVRLETVELADAGLAERVAERLRGGEALAAIADSDAGIRTREVWVDERDLPPELRGQVEAAAAKDVLGPIDAGGKTRVIRVGGQQASRRLSYKESKGLIRKRLLENRRQAALDDWYERAKRQARIEYPPR
jgi:parvulin-like peptidyl-prolyl isomerase